jgi:hypothetical protein
VPSLGYAYGLRWVATPSVERPGGLQP